MLQSDARIALFRGRGEKAAGRAPEKPNVVYTGKGYKGILAGYMFRVMGCSWIRFEYGQNPPSILIFRFIANSLALCFFDQPFQIVFISFLFS